MPLWCLIMHRKFCQKIVFHIRSGNESNRQNEAGSKCDSVENKHDKRASIITKGSTSGVVDVAVCRRFSGNIFESRPGDEPWQTDRQDFLHSVIILLSSLVAGENRWKPNRIDATSREQTFRADLESTGRWRSDAGGSAKSFIQTNPIRTIEYQKWWTGFDRTRVRILAVSVIGREKQLMLSCLSVDWIFFFISCIPTPPVWHAWGKTVIGDGRLKHVSLTLDMLI